MYALVDAIAFYASAEKVFAAEIRKSPVVVLTNNDGCICAVSPEARLLKVPKFEPYFKLNKFLAQNKVVVRSSNYELYADLSERMMTVVSRFCDNQYVYSIDESFLQFKGFTHIVDDWHEYGLKIRRAVWKETKLPVGVGFGPTPTLAKAANHAAKKLEGYQGVAVINDEQSRLEILSKMKVTDVWGIGGRLGKKLNFLNINTALDLANQTPKNMRKQFSVVVERTVNELNGIVCLSWDDVKQSKKEMFSTRSFGKRITEENALKAALVMHCVVVGRKLRAQQSLTKRILVFASSSPHDETYSTEPYFKRSYFYDFPVATSDSTVLANAINDLLPHLFQQGVRYYKCGVGAIELESELFKQEDMFSASLDNPKLMECVDGINKRFGQGTLSLASEGKKQEWKMKRDFMSPRYTTNWCDIPVIKC